jgi:hypothetical protein
MDQLVEALVGLVEEPQNPGAVGAANQGTGASMAYLHLKPKKSVHVSVGNSKKQRLERLCQ